MKLFKYYRITFVLSLLILIIGALLKVTHFEMGLFNGNSVILIGLVSSVVYVVLAFCMLFKSQKMPAGEKLIWVLLFALGFITGIGLITFLTAAVFSFIGKKRLLEANNN